MSRPAALLDYARSKAAELELDMRWEVGQYAGEGWWSATSREELPRIVARAAAAQEFLRQYAGQDSYWYRRATAEFESNGGNTSQETGARNIAELLRGWADQVDAGVVEIAGSRQWEEAGEAGTSLMGQVRQLVQDRTTHPAAAIVLCGAVLEMTLRAAVEARELPITERPSMGSYVKALRAAGLVTAQTVKEVEQCSGLRNAAAHGRFDELSRERAGLMEQQTNLLLRNLADLAAPRAGD